MRLSFNQIFDGFLENMTSTLRGCIETRTQTGFHFGQSGCQTRAYLNCRAQQKISALNGKRNSVTREPLREQTPVSFSILGRYFSFLPQKALRLSCCASLRYTLHKTVDWMLQSVTSISFLPSFASSSQTDIIPIPKRNPPIYKYLNYLCNDNGLA